MVCTVTSCNVSSHKVVSCNYATLRHVTLRHVTLRHVAVRQSTLHCVILRYDMLRYVMLRYLITLRQSTLRCISLRHVRLCFCYATSWYVLLRYVMPTTLRRVMLRQSTVRYVKMHYGTLRYVKIHHVTLRYDFQFTSCHAASVYATSICATLCMKLFFFFPFHRVSCFRHIMLVGDPGEKALALEACTWRTVRPAF